MRTLDVLDCDPHVVVVFRFNARGKRSGIPVGARSLAVFTFHDARIVVIAMLGGAELRPGLHSTSAEK